MVQSAHFVQRGNVALLIGLIPLPEYRQWLIDCVNDDNTNGVLQRHAFFSLGEIGDASVIRQTQELVSHPDHLVKQAFLDMCAKLDPDGSVSLFLDATSRDQHTNVEGNVAAERYLAMVKGSQAIEEMLKYLVNDTQLLRSMSGSGPRGNLLKQVFRNIAAVYNESIQGLLIQLTFALLNIHRGDAEMMKCVAILLKQQAPDIWQDVLSEAFQHEEIRNYLFILSTFLSYFITDENLHEFIENIRNLDHYDWITSRLVSHIQGNKDNPAGSTIEEKAKELLPEYYRNICEREKERQRKLSYEEKRFLEWKRGAFDLTPLQYNKNRFGLFYQCLNNFDETFKLEGFVAKKMRAIVRGILFNIDPEAFQVTIKEWEDGGGVKTFSISWEQVLYEKALKLNFVLDAGFTDRKKLVAVLKVLHSGEGELCENVLRALGPLQPDQVEMIKGFLGHGKTYTSIGTYIQVVRTKKLYGCVDLLKELIKDKKIEYFHRTECLDAIGELTHDKDYLESIFHNDAFDKHIKRKAAHLLITKHQNEEAFAWQIAELKQGSRQDDWHWSGTPNWLEQAKTANAVPLYLDLLKSSYELPSLQGEYTDWLRRVAVEGLKFQKSREAVQALRRFIDENKGKEGVNFLEPTFEELQREYLLLKGKPSSIQDAVIRYNDVNRKVSRRIPDENSLLNLIADIFQSQIKHSIEERGGYKNFYRDRKCQDPKGEIEVQQLFMMWRQYFQALGIHMSLEVGTGRGSVDYIFNYGFVPKIQNCHLEIKLSKHNCIPRSFEPQLNTYFVADQADAGFFLVLRVEDENGPIPDDTKWMQWQKRIAETCEKLGMQRGIPVKPIFIDALKPPPASAIHRG